MENASQSRLSPWPQRLAVALALVTFPLIWVGGLVTTYDAGMAVPDWPGTYGYNLLAYPWQTWLAGPWDLFIEHGHRLLGAAAGLLAIALVASTWWTNQPRWVKEAALLALALVVVQGALGGARVLLDERVVALVHGCVGPLFFAYLAGLIVWTSRTTLTPPADSATQVQLARAAWIAAGLLVAQLVLGAVLRHIPHSASMQVFRGVLVLHLVLAGAALAQIALTSLRAWRIQPTGRWVAIGRILLPGLAVAQVLLGVATYVSKYSWPAWLGHYEFAAAFVVQEKSLVQSLVTTAHVAGGSLLLFCSVMLAMRARCSAHQSATAAVGLTLVTTSVAGRAVA
jgi:cytochrome c oxidase assembly protein subunit 15